MENKYIHRNYRNFTMLLLLALFFATQADAGRKLKVYFAGNSYTFYNQQNDVPLLVQQIANSMGDTLVYEKHTPGGWRLADHADPVKDPICRQKLTTESWDYIILQEQSQLPSFPDNQFFPESFHYAYALDTLIDKNNPCANTVFYMTWGYKNGDPGNCASFPPLCTYEGMDSMIRLRYTFMADSLKELVAPVGAVRHYIRHNFPSINLYTSDNSHPTPEGIYTSAMTFYAMLFKRDPQTVQYNASINPSFADSIKAAVKRVAVDSLPYWNFNSYDFNASFTFAPVGGQQIVFNNTSTNAVTSFWDFGDGDTMTATNPTHTYNVPGQFPVTLTIFDSTHNCTRTATKTVTVWSTSVTPVNKLSFSVYPNPVTDQLHIAAKGYDGVAAELIISNIQGQIVYRERNVSLEHRVISTDYFQPGMYLIHLKAKDRPGSVQKFWKK